MPKGAFRRVLLIGRYAVKVPRPCALLAGMRCNRWEREMWNYWRPQLRWENLCPVLLADPIGFMVVMPRAEQPVSDEELERAIGDYYPDNTAEAKPADYGRLGASVVAVDYGLPWADAVSERRHYYAKHINAPGPRGDA